jgi:hypothetical protein
MNRSALLAPLALATGVSIALAAWPGHAQQASATTGADEVPSGYQDRLISPADLPALPAEDVEEIDTGGLPRAFHAEAAISHGESGDESYREYGFSAGGFRETPRHGTLSLEASLSRRDDARFGNDGDWNGSATLWQRGLAMPGDWRVDNGLGVLNTPALPLQRSQYRFFLPTVLLAGASSDWRNAGTGLQLQASAGRLGHYTGTRLLGFELDEGHVGSLGAQWQWAPGWSGSAAALVSEGRLVPGTQGQAMIENGDNRAVHAATAWTGTRDSVQLNMLASDDDGEAAAGAWLDASARRGRYSHNYGLFQLGEGLAWGTYPINNDVRGGYYRIAYQFARWNWSTGIDRIDSISGDGFEGTYANGYARYQATPSLGYGGSLNLRHGSDTAWSSQAFIDKRTGWGSTRVQFDHADGGNGGADSWQVTLDQAFPVREGARLSASLAHGSLSYDGEDATDTTTLALHGGQDLGNRLSIDGQVRWTHGEGPDAVRGFDANIGFNWRFDRHWSLAATLYQSQGSRRSPFVLDPLATDPLFVTLPRERSAFLVLRYQRDAGRARAVIGGPPGAAVGSINGSVFLDDNDDGSRNAAEAPIANLTVILDGRYAVRTDSAGAFAFPDVAVGTHVLTVLPDNLPLPWSIDGGDSGRTIEVEVRQDLRVDIPATRPR